MPKLLCARDAVDAENERKVRTLAASRHAPGDWIRRARMVVRSWDGLRTSAIAAALGCHTQTVRERLARFNAEGLDGRGDRPGAGRKRRLTETGRGRILALARTTPPGRLMRQREGLPSPRTRRRRRTGPSTRWLRRRASVVSASGALSGKVHLPHV